MLRFPLLVAFAVLALLSAAAPASAVAIRHTNRAGGDPDAAAPAANRGAPPADTSGPHFFDKLHQDAAEAASHG